jgi:excisionase family DNA binding protein
VQNVFTLATVIVGSTSLQRGIVVNSKAPSKLFCQDDDISTGGKKPVTDAGRCERLLDSTEAAQLLRIHPKTLQRMARKGQIPAMQIGKLWRFSGSALLLWQQEKLAG